VSPMPNDFKGLYMFHKDGKFRYWVFTPLPTAANLKQFPSIHLPINVSIYQSKSNQIKSTQIKSNHITSHHIKSRSCVWTASSQSHLKQCPIENLRKKHYVFTRVPVPSSFPVSYTDHPFYTYAFYACWCLLVLARACWCLLVLAGACWCLLVLAGACWCLLVLSYAFLRFLALSRTLSYAFSHAFLRFLARFLTLSRTLSYAFLHAFLRFLARFLTLSDTF
jgi:hypothetical protein